MLNRKEREITDIGRFHFLENENCFIGGNILRRKEASVKRKKRKTSDLIAKGQFKFEFEIGFFGAEEESVLLAVRLRFQQRFDLLGDFVGQEINETSQKAGVIKQQMDRFLLEQHRDFSRFQCQFDRSLFFLRHNRSDRQQIKKQSKQKKKRVIRTCFLK